jgi:hypothetical protein
MKCETCRFCGNEFEVVPRGPSKKYCSRNCCWKAYRERKLSKNPNYFKNLQRKWKEKNPEKTKEYYINHFDDYRPKRLIRNKTNKKVIEARRVASQKFRTEHPKLYKEQQVLCSALGTSRVTLLVRQMMAFTQIPKRNIKDKLILESIKKGETHEAYI